MNTLKLRNIAISLTCFWNFNGRKTYFDNIIYGKSLLESHVLLHSSYFQVMDNFIRELEGQFPSKDTVYEYYIDVKQKFWVLWEDKLRSGLVI